MIRDILVHLPTERQVRPVVDGAVSLAASHGAHVDAVAAGYVSESTAYVMEGGAALATVFELERERAMSRAEAALSVFETEAKAAGISYRCQAKGAFPAEASASLGAAARLYDLTMVVQPETDRQTYDNTLPQEILFHGGGPVLFMPYIFRGALKTKRIGLCWDGSRLAARALRDAAPFLAAADMLIVITINEEAGLIDEASAENLAKHLARHKVPSKIVALTAARSDIQPTILSLAAEEGIDMLVMGAYGHSRLQEMMLGGVTREMLRTMTVPTLMSH
jgi:nucleotide-binding universal stress UspA family protein